MRNQLTNEERTSSFMAYEAVVQSGSALDLLEWDRLHWGEKIHANFSQSTTHTRKKHPAFCQSCQYFINLQLRQSITKHFTNHSITTISCPTPGLEIIQHASQRPREVCKQPGIKTGVARRTHTVCVSSGNGEKPEIYDMRRRGGCGLGNKWSTWSMHSLGEMTKADYQTSSRFWHKHAHCLKRSGSSKWTHFGTEYILDAGLMYRDRPRRNASWRELEVFPSKGKR